MADENTDVTDQGTNEGDPGAGESDNKSVDKTDANDQKASGQQNDGQKKTDDKPAEDDKTTSLLDGKKQEDKEEEPKSQAPESYDEFTLPQGFTMNDIALEAFSPAAKEAGLNQENAQKMIDLYSKLQGQEAKRLNEDFNARMDKQIAAVKSDPEIGGEHYETKIALANKVIGTFGNEGAIEAIRDSGLGTNPDVIRMLVKVGEVISEDVFVDKGDGGGVGGVKTTEKTLGDRLYPKMKT